MPFLAELARADDVDLRTRVELLWLLDAIAAGGTDEEGRRQPEDGPAGAALAALRAEVPTLLPLLDAGEPALALSAAQLAARFGDLDGVRGGVRGLFERARDDAERRFLAAAAIVAGDRREELEALVAETPADLVDPEDVAEFLDGDPRVPVAEDLLGAALRDRLPAQG